MAFRGNLKKRMSRASAAGASVALIIGDEEVAADEVTVKDLATGEQKRIPVKQLGDEPLIPVSRATPVVWKALRDFQP
jgi:histidyl-tRNA synthetase